MMMMNTSNRTTMLYLLLVSFVTHLLTSEVVFVCARDHAAAASTRKQQQFSHSTHGRRTTISSNAAATSSTTTIRECNEEIGDVVTIDDVQSLIDFFASMIPNDPESDDDDVDTEQLRQLIDLSLLYNVTVSKVCLKCSDVNNQDWPTEVLLNTKSTYGFMAYCSIDKYGWDAVHSALMFTPIESSSTQTYRILTGELRGFVAGHDTEIDADAGPTDLWPDDTVSSILQSETLSTQHKYSIFRNFVTSLVASSAGAVSILPDYLGYGESRGYDRAYLQPFPYLQAAGVTYAAAKRYISSRSNGCTVLTDVASTTGYGEGGYFAMLAALALEQNNVDVLSVKSGGTPWELDVQLGYASSQEKESESLELRLMLSYFGYAFSNNFPFMRNANSGQDALAPSWQSSTNFNQSILEWYWAPSPLSADEIASMLPHNIQEIFNPDIVSLYEEALFEEILDGACRDGTYVSQSTIVMCQTILDAGLWDILSNEATFPVSICHSSQDNLIAFDNVPPPTILPSFINYYSSNIEALIPRGTHDESLFLCALDPILNIGITTGGSNSPVLRKPLQNRPDQCLEGDISLLGTSPPVSPPATPQEECGITYMDCSVAPCCPFFSCTPRLIGGISSSVCLPSESKNKGKESIAGEGVGGSIRARRLSRGR
jgi:hypothetical protein